MRFPFSPDRLGLAVKGRCLVCYTYRSMEERSAIIEIRDAKPEDAGRLLEIYDHYVRHTAISFEYETPTLAAFQERMRETMRRYPYLVILREGRIEGYAYGGPFVGRAAYGWSCETTIYLDQAARKCGLGRRIYEALEGELRQMGIRNMYACIGVPEQEDAYLTMNSADFHAHLGFVKVGEFHRCGCKFGRWYDMVWMEKVIGPHERNPAPIRFYPTVVRRDKIGS